MKFMLLTYLDENAWEALSEAEKDRVMAECKPHTQALVSAKKFLGGSPLHSSSLAKTVKIRDGKRVVTDGPFAETKEQLGGYTLIEARDLDEAMKIAAEYLGQSSLAIIEVRQVAELDWSPTH
jgi:hypothetical protein